METDVLKVFAVMDPLNYKINSMDRYIATIQILGIVKIFEGFFFLTSKLSTNRAHLILAVIHNIYMNKTFQFLPLFQQRQYSY